MPFDNKPYAAALAAGGPFTRAEVEANWQRETIQKQNETIQKQNKIIKDKDLELETLRIIIDLSRVKFSCP
jgi:hypothetical protein